MSRSKVYRVTRYLRGDILYVGEDAALARQHYEHIKAVSTLDPDRRHVHRLEAVEFEFDEDNMLTNWIILEDSSG